MAIIYKNAGHFSLWIEDEWIAGEDEPIYFSIGVSLSGDKIFFEGRVNGNKVTNDNLKTLTTQMLTEVNAVIQDEGGRRLNSKQDESIASTLEYAITDMLSGMQQEVRVRPLSVYR